MGKRNFQLFCLVFSLLYLLYMVFEYCGYIRYASLYLNDTESYIASYPSLPRADPKNRVVLCFAASEEELPQLKPFINSLLDQTVRVDDIALTVPYKGATLSDPVKKVVSVYNYSKDYDDAGNLICSVLREPEANTKIIMVEPSMVYGEDFVEQMVQESQTHEDKVIYGDKSKDRKWGILVKPKFFDEAITDYKNGKGCCAWLNECCKAGGDRVISYSPTFKRWN